MIALRKLEPKDLDAVHGLISNIDVVRYMLLPQCSREESEKFVRDAIEETSSEPWQSVVRAVIDPVLGKIVGLCGIVRLRGTVEGELWYLVRPKCWHKGIATEAAKAILALGFEDMALHRIWATCLPENPASARVLEKVGMRWEGSLVKNLRIHGEWKNSCLYAMLDEEWRRINTALLVTSAR